jgi:predicted metal-dependent phosphoesterase TrpH
VLDRYHDWQRQYGAGMVRGMQRLGLAYSEEDRRALLESYRPARTLAVQGLTHVGNTTLMRHFMAKGFVKSQQEYGELLGRLRKMGELPPYPPAQEVVPHVLASGAIIALAHPTGYVQTDPARIDSLRSQCRFDGIECAHPSIPAQASQFYREYCRRNGMFSTGGSDSHSDEDLDAALAGHGGQPECLDEFLARLTQ